MIAASTSTKDGHGRVYGINSGAVPPKEVAPRCRGPNQRGKCERFSGRAEVNVKSVAPAFPCAVDSVNLRAAILRLGELVTRWRVDATPAKQAHRIDDAEWRGDDELPSVRIDGRADWSVRRLRSDWSVVHVATAYRDVRPASQGGGVPGGDDGGDVIHRSLLSLRRAQQHVGQQGRH